MNGQRKEFRMIATTGNHVALKIGKEDLINYKYNRSDKCSNQHENKNDLEKQKERKHEKEYDEVDKVEREELKREENGNEIVCNLCE